MDKYEINTYFENQAISDEWDSLYDSKNPISFPFIDRLNKTNLVLKSIKYSDILDLGCGTGIIIKHVIKKNNRYTGIDYSLNMINTIKYKYNNLINDYSITLLNDDFDLMEINKMYNLVIGLGFIEYSSNPEHTINKIYSKLDFDGSLILSFPNKLSLDYLMLKVLSILKVIIKVFLGKYTKQPPRTLWKTTDAIKILKNNGFRIKSLHYYNTNILFYPITRFFPKFCSTVGLKIESTSLNKFPMFSTGFIIHCQK